MSEHDETKHDNPDVVRVIDRRRFDADGNDREEKPSSSEKPAQTMPTSPTPRPSPANGHVDGEPAAAASRGLAHEAGFDEHSGAFRMETQDPNETDVSFTSFVMSMATQALVQMGEMDPPPGMEIPVDVPAARQTIDILSMLQRKTRGNLSPDEGRFIEEVLHTLRMSYVRAAS